MAVKKTKGDLKSLNQQTITVEVRPANIETVDIGAWKSAVNAAKLGRRNALYRLYENILVDGVFSRAIEKRIEAITNAELVFTDSAGKPVQEILDLMDTPEFEHMLKEIMGAKMWGVSVIDIESVLPFSCYSVPRRNLDVKRRIILPDEYSDTGLGYEDNPYIFQVEDSDPLGIIYKAAQYVIYKRGGYGDWAQMVELFGMPFRLGRYSAYDTTTRDELIKSLKMFGAAPWAVVPEEAEIEMVEHKTNTDGALYDKFLDRCDKEILITVLGQTMTTIDGSSKSQSETHKEVEEDINKSDRKFVRRILNRHLLPILESAGLKVTGGKFEFPEQGETLSTKQRVEIALSIKNDAKVPVSDSYFYEISGVKKPEKGEQVSGSNPDPDPDPADPKAPKAPKAPAPKSESDNLFSRLFSFFAKALEGRAPLKY